MGCLTFYESQGRLDGAFCDYSNSDKMEFLQKCKKLGIVNFEMEVKFCVHPSHVGLSVLRLFRPGIFRLPNLFDGGIVLVKSCGRFIISHFDLMTTFVNNLATTSNNTKRGKLFKTSSK
jgi:hypothetical protein